MGVKTQGGILDQVLARNRNRVSAGRHSRATSSAMLASWSSAQVFALPTCRTAAKLNFLTDEELAGGPHGPGEGSGGGGRGSRRRRRCRDAAEPEVIKKGKQETEGEAAAQGGRKRPRRPRRRSRLVKLIVGLGNPGIEYQFTLHNLGFLAVDRIAEQCGVRVINRRCRA